jgi:WD40 repeat protein
MSTLRAFLANAERSGARADAGAAVRLCLVALLGCSWLDPSSPSYHPPPTGSALVRASTTGTDPDANGYVLGLDRLDGQVRLDANGSIRFANLILGEHALFISDVAPNCVSDAVPVRFTIPDSKQEVVVDVRITCSALGSVQVSVATTGPDLDPDGYRVTVTGTSISDVVEGLVGANATVVVPRVAPGRHVVSFWDVAGNCDTAGPARREVDVQSAGVVAVSFDFSCESATWVAYVQVEPVRNSEIWVIRSNRTGARRLTDNPATDEQPAWSPDGARIAFTSDRDGRQAIFVMNADGTGVRRLTDAAFANYHPTWSPDGTRIAFTSERDADAEIYVMNADGTDQRRLTTQAGLDTDPAWSPDGTRIAFTSNRDGDEEIYVMNANGSGVTRVTVNPTWDRHPAWSPDGTRLAFSRNQCGFYSCYPAVMVVGFAGPPAEEVGQGDEPSWSPDGRKLAVTSVECTYYYELCSVTGLGILNAAGKNAPNIWQPGLTSGFQKNPAWQP